MTKNTPEKIMKYTVMLTAVCTIVFTALYKVYMKSGFLAAAITFGTTCYHLVMRLAVGFCYNQFIKQPLNYHAKWFIPKPFEKNLYQKLKVKNWKNKVPTYKPESFSMENYTPKEIIQTMCISEIGHETMAVFSFLPLFMTIPFGELRVFMTTSLLAAGFDMMFVIIQRYNRPRLVRLAERTIFQNSLQIKMSDKGGNAVEISPEQGSNEK